MADLLRNLSKLGVYNLMMEDHILKLESQLVDQHTKSFISLVWVTMKRFMRFSKLDFGYRG